MERTLTKLEEKFLDMEFKNSYFGYFSGIDTDVWYGIITKIKDNEILIVGYDIDNKSHWYYDGSYFEFAQKFLGIPNHRLFSDVLKTYLNMKYNLNITNLS